MPDECGHIWAIQDELGRPFCAECGVPWSVKFHKTRKENAALHFNTFRSNGAAGCRALHLGRIHSGEDMMNEDRAKLAYETFRNGLKNPDDIPTWGKASSWIRDIVIVGYLQGRLDALAARHL